jgi:lambda family phage portal protein
MKLLDQYGNPLRPDRPPRPRRPVSARYDLDRESTANRKHWSGADHLSARAANSPAVRKKLRERSRYEAENNGHYQGLIETLAHDKIGTGPRLQLTLTEVSPEGAARLIERRFASWANDPVVDYPEKLRVLDQSETRDGECFALLTSNPLVEDGVKLDLALVETDQVETPDLGWDVTGRVSGVVFDRWKNPVAYHVLREHPGDGIWTATDEYDSVPAEFALHWFRPARVGQARGVPRLTPGIPLCNQLRRYSLATLTAAEVQASLTAFLKSDLPADYTGQPTSVSTDAEDYFDALEIVRGMMSTLPPGTDVVFPSNTHPHGNYEAFKAANLTEIGRGVHAPRNVVLGDSSGYNFSSSRLDLIIYGGAIKVERRRLRPRVLDRVFRAWLAEAALVPDYLPADLPPVSEWVWSWQFDGRPSIDPAKDASAAQMRIAMGLSTYAEELSEEGRDWEETFEQIAREQKRAKELGVTLAYAAAAAPAAPAAAPPPDEEDDEEDAPNAHAFYDTPLDVGGRR